MMQRHVIRPHILQYSCLLLGGFDFVSLTTERWLNDLKSRQSIALDVWVDDNQQTNSRPQVGSIQTSSK